MTKYYCDQCKQKIDINQVVYMLTVTYGPTSTKEMHFHWDCLKVHVNE